MKDYLVALLRRPRARVLLAGTAVVVVLIVAITITVSVTGSRGGQASAASTSSKSAAATPTDCDQYLKLSAAQKEKAFTGKTITIYGTGGAVKTPVTQLFDKDCPSHAGQSYDLGSVKVDESFPECSVFTTLTPQQQDTWVPSLLKEQYWAMPAPATTAFRLDQLCTELGVDNNLVRLSHYDAQFTKAISWSTQTKLGYTWQSTIGLGAIETVDQVSTIDGGQIAGSNGIPTDGPSYKPGVSCGFNPKTDAVIPVTLHAWNTTPGSRGKIPMGLTWSLQVVGGTTPITTAYLEDQFSDGPSCSQQADSFRGASFGVTWTTPSTDVWSDQQAIILKNWYSPRFPTGATADLSDYQLVGMPNTPNSSDPTVSIASATVTLDGLPLSTASAH